MTDALTTTPGTPLAKPPLLDLTTTALFLDFDGTLVGFADRPEGVVVGEGIVGNLGALHYKLSGALAIVTGRDVATIDDFLTPLRLTVAGVHGLDVRGPDGSARAHDVSGCDLDALEGALRLFSNDLSGVLVERKSQSVALHYRLAPTEADACLAACEHALKDVAGFKVLGGKYVYELRSDLADKGRAIAALMKVPPFAGRMPVFVGDDVTDEDGFETVNSEGGISIKVGFEPTSAMFQLAGPDDVVAWLGALVTSSDVG